jgi:hypothetical protein
MSKHPKKARPPLSPAKVLARISRAEREQGLVSFRRWIPKADWVAGFIVGRSDRWVLLARLSDGVALDGWVGVRLEDIQSVTRFPVEDCFEIKALQAREQWPPRPPDGMALEGTENLLRTAKHQGPMVSVFREFERPNVCWIGSVRKIEGDTMSLLEVNVAGGWARKPRLFDLDDITRIEFGGGYEEALGLVAGAPPPTR